MECMEEASFKDSQRSHTWTLQCMHYGGASAKKFWHPDALLWHPRSGLWLSRLSACLSVAPVAPEAVV